MTDETRDSNFSNPTETESENVRNQQEVLREPDYDLLLPNIEDIMSEYGGWTNKGETREFQFLHDAELQPDNPADGEMPNMVKSNAANASETDSPSEAHPSKFHFIQMDFTPEEDLHSLENDAQSGDEPRMNPIASEDTELWEWDSDEEKTEKKTQLKDVTNELRSDKSDVTKHIPPSKLFRYYSGKIVFSRFRAIFLTFLAILSAFFTVSDSFSWRISQLLANSSKLSVVLLVLMLVASLSCFDMFLSAWKEASQRRFQRAFQGTFVCIICIIDAIFSLFDGSTPFGSIVTIILCIYSWSDYFKTKSYSDALQLQLSKKELVAVEKKCKISDDVDGIFRVKIEDGNISETLHEENITDSVFRIYSPLAILFAVIGSATVSILKNISWIHLLTAAICASFPAGAFLCYYGPFCQIEKKLAKTGNALAGWASAHQLIKNCGVVLTDADFFPHGTVALNGIKVYNDYNFEQIVSYGASALVASESHLGSVFRKLTEEQGIRLIPVGTFRTYEGGGIGAEIRGDIVLIGPAGFMSLMGIHLPNGTNIKQAVYLAINGEIAGIFALKYKTKDELTFALQTALRKKGVSILCATRDFLLTPSFLHRKFRIPTAKIECPSVSERYRISDVNYTDLSGNIVGLMSRGKAIDLLAVVVGGKNLRSAVFGELLLTICSGLFGLLLILFFAFSNAFQVISATNVFWFSFIWLLPEFLIIAFSNQF